jgi:hypothetical protein
MSAWTGIAIGGAAGGLAGYFVGRKLLKHDYIGVAVAAAAFGALAGGALTASSASASSTASSTSTTNPPNLPAKTNYTLSLDGTQTSALMHLGDVVALTPPPGVTATFTTNNSDAILALNPGDGVYQAMKLGGGIVTATLSSGVIVKVKIEVAA